MTRCPAFPTIRERPLAPDPPTDIAAAPRPWLTRREGECAFPVDGVSWRTRACCNPSGAEIYCEVHRALMYLPTPPEDLTLDG